MTTARRVKTDAERAADELALYEKRVERSTAALESATATYEGIKAAHEKLVAVRDHLRNHPALAVAPGDPSMPDWHEYEAPTGTSDGGCAVEGCGLAESLSPPHQPRAGAGG